MYIQYTPSVNLVVLRLGAAVMCRSDEIGEICISSISCGSGYFGLPGKTEQNFKVSFLFKFLVVYYLFSTHGILIIIEL